MSTQSIPLLTLTLAAASAVAVCRFVTPLGAQAGADANTLGASCSAAGAGERFPVDVRGTTTLEAGAAVTVGATLKSDAQGRAITWAASGAKVGIALEAATAAGQFIEVLLVDNAA